MQAGGLLAAGLLILWALLPSIAMTYLVWAALGLCMAAILYEPVFVIVGRAYHDADARLRAIATVTVTGGLASTVFFPGTSALVTRLGWRETAAVLGVIIAITTVIVGQLRVSRSSVVGGHDPRSDSRFRRPLHDRGPAWHRTDRVRPSCSRSS